MSQNLLPFYDESSKMRVDGFFVDERSRIIYFAKSFDGRLIRFSCKVKSPNIIGAKRFANQEIKVRLGIKKARITSLIGDELKPYYKMKESEGWQDGTLKNIRNAIEQIKPFFGDKFPYEINRDSLGEWYEWLDQTYPGQQKENAVKYMRNFCRYLAEKVVNGVPLLPAVPMISDPDRKALLAERHKKKFLIFSDEEFKKIHDVGNDVEKLVALFMYTMAARIEETLTLRFGSEILLDEALPLYRWRPGQNKAGHAGEHFLHPSLIEPLKAAMVRSESLGTSLVFPQKFDVSKPLKPAQIEWDGWRDRAALPWHWTSHTFRHTCLSNLFNDPNAPTALICKLYRVSIKVAMDTYIKPTREGREKMRDILKVQL